MSKIIRISRRALLLVFLLLTQFSIVGCSDARNADSISVAAEEVKIDTSALKNLFEENCLSCHGYQEQRIGPALAAISAVYTDADESSQRRLENKIIYGGAGVWGDVPMIENPQISDEQAKALLTWILNESWKI